MAAKKSISVKSLSVSVRLGRTTVEEAFVSFPISADMWKPKNAGGKSLLDVAKVMEEALGMGSDPDTASMADGTPVIDHHPIQNPPPLARRKPN